MRSKPVKCGCKFWVGATPLAYAIQVYPYAGKDENYDSNLGLGGSVVATLAEKLPSQVGSNYHIIMGNFFTSPNLLCILKAKSIAATRTVRINFVENAPLQTIKEIEKLRRRAPDAVTYKNSNPCSMEGQQSDDSSVYNCSKNSPRESSSFSSKWKG